MNLDDPLKLQSFLDGELSPDETRTVAALIQRDPAAAALLAELKNTRQTLRQIETPVAVAASREFYWTRIKQDIERLDQPRTAPPRPGFLANLRFLILPAAAITVLLIIGLALHYHAKPVMAAKPAGGVTNTVETALAATATNDSPTR